MNLQKLTNVAEVLTGDENSVVQHILAIILAHERSMAIDPDNVSLDLLFNSALVYTEAIDENEEYDIVALYATIAQDFFRKVLKQQVNEFQDFLLFTLALPENNEAPISSSEAPDSRAMYSSTKTAQPPDILDTVISGLQLCQAVLENMGRLVPSHGSPVNHLESFAQDLVTIADDLVQNFTDSTKAVAIEESQRNEYLISKTYVRALLCSDLAGVYLVWESANLPNIPQKFMLAADSIECILERLDLNTGASGPEDVLNLYWGALSKMNIYFKNAQELLNEEYQAKKGPAVSVGVLIDQICRVYIARSDIDLQRCQIQNEQGQKNSQVLLNNAKAFLKNCMNLAKVSGGIRETAMEKAQRERRRYEAVSRLCLLEGKSTPEELNNILGSGMWEEDFANYKDLWYFQRFL